MRSDPDEPTLPPGGPDGPSRRQLLLAFGGVTFGAAGYGYGIRAGGSRLPGESGISDDSPASPSHITETTALAAAVYPSSVSVDEPFIERRVFGRVEPRPGHFQGVVAAIEAVDGHATARFGGCLSDLSPARRRQVLASMGVTEVHPIPDGSTAERVRHYLVNDLLFALFTSPASSHLTGIENPPGHPGGLDAYQRGPDSR